MQRPSWTHLNPRRYVQRTASSTICSQGCANGGCWTAVWLYFAVRQTDHGLIWFPIVGIGGENQCARCILVIQICKGSELVRSCQVSYCNQLPLRLDGLTRAYRMMKMTSDDHI